MEERLRYWLAAGGLFALFAVATSVYLHRVPGLLGDEGSEGENVYELLTVRPLTVVGERSYIGPLLDYVRVPFVLAFGYSALSLRLVTLLFSWGFFWLLAYGLRGLRPAAALSGLVAVCFSPVYLTQQRLGWAIVLLPFFAALTVALAVSSLRWRWLLAGLAAGTGLSTHILFLPTLAGLVASGVIVLSARWRALRWHWRRGAGAAGLLAVGFWAGFGMQFAVLRLFTDDQGEPAAVAQAFGGRLAALPRLVPLLVSGSSYIARYTGREMGSGTQWLITAVLGALVLAGGLFMRRRLAAAVLTGTIVHVVVLLYMVDRFALRYFVMLTLMVWLLAGLGAGLSLDRLLQRWRAAAAVRKRWLGSGAVAVLTVGLTAWSGAAVLVPYLATGGSTADFSLATRTDSAAALVDVRPLTACLSGRGPIFTENVHIWNRLQFLSHSRADLLPAHEEGEARLTVHYRRAPGLPGAEDCARAKAEVCPQLKHFCVVPAL